MLRNISYKQIFLVVFMALLVVVGYWYYHNVYARNLVTGVIRDPSENLTTLNRRVNILLLGIGGDGHEGSDLTDSMMFISLNVDSQKALLIPLPRDLWIDSLKAKINTAYHYGKERRENGGRDLVKSAVAEVVGQPVHYVLVLDFSGFEKVIDAVGGIEVNVERTFDDYKYPIPGKEDAEPESERYTHVHFDAGQTHMNGETALQFTRSRHAEGEEGTDFARSKRQEKILLAFRDKVLSTQTLLNNDRMTALLNSIASSIDTDITEREYGSFAKLALSMDRQAGLNNISLESYLQNPKNRTPYLGQYVLIPKDSWQELHEYVKANLPN